MHQRVHQRLVHGQANIGRTIHLDAPLHHLAGDVPSVLHQATKTRAYLKTGARIGGSRSVHVRERSCTGRFMAYRQIAWSASVRVEHRLEDPP